MAQEATTIARPYAEAAFARAVETGKLDLWSDMLEMLAVAAKDPALSGLIANQGMDRTTIADLVLEIGGGRLSEEGQNLVRLLAQNRRLSVLPQIAAIYESLKADHEGALEVHVTTAFEMKPAQETALAEALKKKYGREIRISSEQDPELIGGVRIRAGDQVIDGSIRSGLDQLAGHLGI